MKLRTADLEIEVRPGTADDVPLLLSFIRSMAEFEKLEVHATEEILRESLFGERPAAHTLLAFVDGKPAAYVVYFFSFATMVIPSNDAFLASGDDPMAIELFDADGNIIGPVEIIQTGAQVLDAGTEVNTEADAPLLDQTTPNTGLTEGGVVSSINPRDGERKIGSIGIRIPYQDMKVVNIGDDGTVRDCEPNEIGTIAIRGQNVFPGYTEEIHNKGVWLGDGWMNTGDMGRMDDDHYFWLTGRKKELIIRGGVRNLSDSEAVAHSFTAGLSVGLSENLGLDGAYVTDPVGPDDSQVWALTFRF